MEMLNRPKPGENEEDVLNMQQAYLAEKAKNPNVQPAAKVINARKHSASTSSVQQTKEDPIKKKSKFAEKRGFQSSASSNKNNIHDVAQEDSEKNIPKFVDNVFYPVPKGHVLGDIIERTKISTSIKSSSTMKFSEATINENVATSGTSIFAKTMLKKCRDPLNPPEENMEIDVQKSNYVQVLSDSDRNEIERQNTEILNQMSLEEIEKEKQKILNNLDSGLIEFLRKKNASKKRTDDNVSSTVVASITNIQNDPNYDMMDAPNEVLSHPLSHTWVHFDQCEAEKLKWTTDVKVPTHKLKPGETYEARFDFNGALLDYNPDDIQATELYHHGEEPHRPGYTMKELFKLSRAQVQQQRIISLNCLSGILERHILGGYWFLDLPIAKIFFIIRFAMDDNVTAVLQSAVKAMRALMWNHIDEACLDSTTCFTNGLVQPLLNSLTKARQDNNKVADINDIINYKPDENEEEEMTDYHIAENDVIQCALRTDLLPRIRYILNCIRPNLITVEYCLQILIRFSRESEVEVEKILKCEGILEVIVIEFLPLSIQNLGKDDNKAYKTPIPLALKLFRVIISHSVTFANNIYKRFYGVITALQCYLSAIMEANISSITLQIEAMNTWAVFLSYGLAQQEFTDMFPIIMRQLDYHVRATHIRDDSSALLHSHGAALLSMISHAIISEKFLPLLVSGLCNWCQQIVRLQNYSSGHLRLVTSAFSALTIQLSKQNITNGYIYQEIRTLNEKFLVQMIQSKGFENLCSFLSPSSNLLSNITEKPHPVPSATQIGACLPETKNVLPPTLGTQSPFLFLESVTSYLLAIKKPGVYSLLFNNESLQKYLKAVANSQLHLVSHWFTRMEYSLLLNIIKLYLQNPVESEKQIIYTISYKLSYLLSHEFQEDLLYILKEVIFNKNFFSEERRLANINLENEYNLLDNLGDIFDCYSKVLGIEQKFERKLCLTEWNHSMLPLDWAYMPIVGFYSHSQNRTSLKEEQEEQQRDIIKCCLSWIILSESYIPEQTSNMSSTDRFCRLLCVFLCHNSLFLDADIKPLLEKSIMKIFQITLIQPFDFDKPLQGLSSFTDLYTQLLEHYQAVSYGDELFSACVLVPLAQFHNICWRKQIWSEHVALLRVLNCSEAKMCYPLNAYLYPLEEDASLLSCYKRALQALLRPNSIPFVIASHHVSQKK